MKSYGSIVRALLATTLTAAALSGCASDGPVEGEAATGTPAPPAGRTLSASLVRADGGAVAFSAVLGEPIRDAKVLPYGYPNPDACAFDPARDVLVPLTMHGVADVDLVAYLMTVEGPAPVAVVVNYGGGSPTCVSLPTAGVPVTFGAQWSNAAQPRMIYVNKAVILVRGIAGTAGGDETGPLRKTVLKLIDSPVEEGRPVYQPRDCVPAPCSAGFPLVA